MKRIIIGFSGKIGAGKTTAAKLLYARSFTRVRFAGPLKAMVAALGLDEAEIDGERKEKPCALLGGKTPRWAMQTLGTDWGRALIDEQLWVNAWKLQVRKLGDYIPVVADDVRFENEAKAIRELGGVVVRIVRDGLRADGHASEAMDFPADYVIENNGPEADLDRHVMQIVNGLRDEAGHA